MTFFSCIPQKRTKSLQLTIALYYLPIVLSITTKHNIIPFFVWSPDWEMLQNCICRTGHSLTESPITVMIMMMLMRSVGILVVNNSGNDDNDDDKYNDKGKYCDNYEKDL